MSKSVKTPRFPWDDKALPTVVAKDRKKQEIEWKQEMLEQLEEWEQDNE